VFHDAPVVKIIRGTASAVGEWNVCVCVCACVCVEYWWNGTDSWKPYYPEKKSRCHFVNHESPPLSPGVTWDRNQVSSMRRQRVTTWPEAGSPIPQNSFSCNFHKGGNYFTLLWVVRNIAGNATTLYQLQ